MYCIRSERGPQSEVFNSCCVWNNICSFLTKYPELTSQSNLRRGIISPIFQNHVCFTLFSGSKELHKSKQITVFLSSLSPHHLSCLRLSPSFSSFTLLYLKVFFFHRHCLLLICPSNLHWKVNTQLIHLCWAFHSPLSSKLEAINTWVYKMHIFRIM